MESSSSDNHDGSRSGGEVDAESRGRDMPTVVLLPIHPEYVDLIREGVKLVEFRRTNFRRKFKYVIVYATSPEKRIAGFCEVSHVSRKSPEELWSEHGDKAGIGRDKLLSYLDGLSVATAIVISRFHDIGEMLSLSAIGVSRAPQGFQYVSESVIDSLKRYSGG